MIGFKIKRNAQYSINILYLSDWLHKICGLRKEKTRQRLEIRFMSLDFAVNNQSYSQATGRFSRQSRVWSSLRTDGLLFHFLNREGGLKGDGGRWTALGRSRIIQTESIRKSIVRWTTMIKGRNVTMKDVKTNHHNQINSNNQKIFISHYYSGSTSSRTTPWRVWGWSRRNGWSWSSQTSRGDT